MKGKCTGSMMLELLVAIAILIIASLMIMTATISLNKSIARRNMYEKIDRVSYCIMNEVKYNYSYNEVIEKMRAYNNQQASMKIVKFKYTEDILDKLISETSTKNLFNLEYGEEIKLEIISGEIKPWDNTSESIVIGDIEKNRVEMKLIINVITAGGVVSSERNFNKSWWMES